MGLRRYLQGNVDLFLVPLEDRTSDTLAVVRELTAPQVDHHLQLLEGLQLPLPGGVAAPDRQPLLPLHRSRHVSFYEHDRAAMEGGRRKVPLYGRRKKHFA